MSFPRLLDACRASIAEEHELLFFGNGGSAADAQHFARELVVRYQTGAPSARLRLRRIPRPRDRERLWLRRARQIDALCTTGEVAIGISMSGNSESVIRGLRAARERRAVAAALTGGSGGRVVSLVDYAIVVPSTRTARIQDMHVLLGHTLCALLESEVGRQ